jgi:hypothetical protein
MESPRLDGLLKCWHIESRMSVGKSGKFDGNPVSIPSRNSNVVLTPGHLAAGFGCNLVERTDYDQGGHCHNPLLGAARRIERNCSTKPARGLGFDVSLRGRKCNRTSSTEAHHENAILIDILLRDQPVQCSIDILDDFGRCRIEAGLSAYDAPGCEDIQRQYNIPPGRYRSPQV